MYLSSFERTLVTFAVFLVCPQIPRLKQGLQEKINSRRIFYDEIKDKKH